VVKKQTYNFVLTPGIKEALEIAAEKDRRSMSSLLEKIIIDYLDKENIPWSNDVKDKAAATTRSKKPLVKK
jgi:hypothetical protein